LNVLTSVTGADAVTAAEIPRSWYGQFDLVLEAVGGAQAESLQLAIELASGGGEVIVLGAFDAGYKLPVAARAAFGKELTLKGSFSYSATAGRRDMTIALDLLRRRQVIGTHLVEVVPSLIEFEAALAGMGRHDGRDPIKLVLCTESSS
jgi:threonine dehydrogenase-like Zn-dependent dehydrogenase